jgi:hypothetical protein
MINSAERHFPPAFQSRDAPGAGEGGGGGREEGQTRLTSSRFENGRPVDGVCWGRRDDSKWAGGLGTGTTVLRVESKDLKCRI